MLGEEIRVLPMELEGLAEDNEEVKLLMTIPGIGYYSALLVKSEVDDVSRFPFGEKLCSYAGLVPSMRASGGLMSAKFTSKLSIFCSDSKYVTQLATIVYNFLCLALDLRDEINLKCPVCNSKLSYDTKLRKIQCDWCGWKKLLIQEAPS